MKALFIVYNQEHTDSIEEMMEEHDLKGYTQWESLKGRGTIDGKPHLGTYNYPDINNAIISICEEEQIDPILEKLKEIDAEKKELGLSAFVWDITRSI
jgi:nitrogen regulatory protein PII